MVAERRNFKSIDWSQFGFFLNVALSIVTLISFCTPLLSPENWPLLAILGLSYSIQLLGHFAFILLWLIAKSRYILISIVFLIIEICKIQGVISIAAFPSSSNDQEALVIGNYNMQFSKLVENGHFDAKDFRNFLKEQNDIDILALQECGKASMEYIRQSMTFEHQYSPPASRVLILSKYPIIQSGSIKEGFSGANNCIWTDIKKERDTLRVYSLHLESNRYDGVIPQSVNEEEEEQVSTKVLLGLIQNYPHFSEKRTQQAISIKRHQNQSPHPVIIAGDFNDVPLSRVYSLLASGLKDTFKNMGNGVGTTIQSPIPGLRIDYVLTSPQYDILGYEIKKAPFSDHFLQRVTLQYK